MKKKYSYINVQRDSSMNFYFKNEQSKTVMENRFFVNRFARDWFIPSKNVENYWKTFHFLLQSEIWEGVMDSLHVSSMPTWFLWWNLKTENFDDFLFSFISLEDFFWGGSRVMSWSLKGTVEWGDCWKLLLLWWV